MSRSSGAKRALYKNIFVQKAPKSAMRAANTWPCFTSFSSARNFAPLLLRGRLANRHPKKHPAVVLPETLGPWHAAQQTVELLDRAPAPDHHAPNPTGRESPL